MKNLNKISIILTLLITIFSCSKDDIVTNNQTQLSDEEKESIRNSGEFKKIKVLNTVFINEIARYLVKNPKLVKEITSNDYTSSELLEKLNLKNKTIFHEREILDLSKKVFSRYPKIEHLNDIEKQELVDELLIEKEKKTNDSLHSFNNPCQSQFEQDFQYIHGQYDSEVMGAAIGIITGGVTGNPVSIAVGAGVSVIAVFRAIFNIAQAIDAYNECVGGSGVNSEPIISNPIST